MTHTCLPGRNTFHRTPRVGPLLASNRGKTSLLHELEVILLVCRNIYWSTKRNMATPSKMGALVKLAQNGPIRARDLAQAKIPRAYLIRLCERGVLERVERGIYRLADAPVTELHSLAQASLRVPKATICLLSALLFHELTTELPYAVWMMIDRHARSPGPTQQSLEIVRASGHARDHGVEVYEIEGVSVKITSPAKTVADCFRYRRHVGLDVAMSSLRDYLDKKAGSVDALVAAAKADRVYSLMRPYMEILV